MEPFLLQTKLNIPKVRSALVRRERLVSKLEAWESGQLILLSAPAGYGKTTLVTEWISQSTYKDPVCWYALDEDDSDPLRFFRYLAAAVTPLFSHPPLLSQQVNSAQSLSPKQLMQSLLHDLSARSEPFALVLDDYHLVESKKIDEALRLLIEHLPAEMRLIITTREDPSLPRARLRAQNRLLEIRAIDLRFTSSEAAQFFNGVMGLSLQEAEIAALEARTEGWIAGLQLAALSMQGRSDVAAFVRAFSGGHHYILDYLIEEVLQQQSAATRSFLLQTAILKRLNGSLCDAVTGRTDSQGMLIELEQSNLFTISLDDERRWYRYHHLFAEVIRSRLVEEVPAEDQAAWHLRASGWYAAHNLLFEAIDHALAAPDHRAAADLMERLWPQAHRSRLQTANFIEWLAVMPDELIEQRPLLSVGFGWELLNAGELATAERWLRVAERWVSRSAGGSEEPIISNRDEVELLPAEVASALGYLALAKGEIPMSIEQAKTALDLLSAEEYIRRGPPAALLGLALWGIGEIEAGYEALAHSMENFRKAGNLVFSIAGTYGLGDMLVALGRLQAAFRLYAEKLEQLSTASGPALQGTADLYLGLC